VKEGEGWVKVRRGKGEVQSHLATKGNIACLLGCIPSRLGLKPLRCRLTKNPTTKSCRWGAANPASSRFDRRRLPEAYEASYPGALCAFSFISVDALGIILTKPKLKSFFNEKLKLGSLRSVSTLPIDLSIKRDVTQLLTSDYEPLGSFYLNLGWLLGSGSCRGAHESLLKLGVT